MTTNDPLYNEAVKIFLETGKHSIQKLQRRLNIGYARAMRLIESMKTDDLRKRKAEE